MQTAGELTRGDQEEYLATVNVRPHELNQVAIKKIKPLIELIEIV